MDRRDSVRTLSSATLQNESTLPWRYHPGVVPVQIVIEHCGNHISTIAGRRIGEVVGEFLRQTIQIQTIDWPGDVLQYTTWAEVEANLRRAYLSEYAYRTHENSISGDSDLVMKVTLQLPIHPGFEKTVCAENWIEVLELMELSRMQDPVMADVIPYIAVLTARFTFPAVG